jgi:hypothetical protein
MSKEKPNILFERINAIQRQLDTLINYHATMPQQQLGTNPYDFVKDASDCKVLIYHQGTYFDRKGKDKGLLYERLGITKPSKENFMKNITDTDLPTYLKPYGVEVALAKPLITGDLITTLGHIISSRSYSVRLYKLRINNYIKLVYAGKVYDLNLGELVWETFNSKIDRATQNIIYIDNNFLNNRIDNLELQR